MPTCCHAEEYSRLFGGGEATARAWVFDRFGLHGTARRTVEFAAAAGGPGATLLEIGGGLGEIHVALLDDGLVDVATNLELSSGWEDRAASLLTHHGLRDRVERRQGDVVDEVDELRAADIVIAHRVLCCYPYWERMVDALAALARRRLVVTLPVDRPRTRTMMSFGNGLLRLRGNRFRTFVHPVDAILDRLAQHGFAPVEDDAGMVWRTIALEPQGA